MEVLAAEAGISYTEYQLMDDYDIAVWIVGYRRRVNEHMRSLRQSSFWNMLPHVKSGSLENAMALGALPDEGSKLPSPPVDRDFVLAKIAESWGDDAT